MGGISMASKITMKASRRHSLLQKLQHLAEGTSTASRTTIEASRRETLLQDQHHLMEGISRASRVAMKAVLSQIMSLWEYMYRISCSMEGSTPSARFIKVAWRHRTLRFQTTGVNRGLRPFHAPTLDVRSWVRSSAYQGHAVRAAAGMAQREEGAQDIGEALNIFLLAWKLVLQAERCALEYYPQVARTRLERSIASWIHDAV
jgi:hypothetical protein